MLTVKSEILDFINIFVGKSHRGDHQTLQTKFVGAYLTILIKDYQNAIDDRIRSYQNLDCINGNPFFNFFLSKNVFDL